MPINPEAFENMEFLMPEQIFFRPFCRIVCANQMTSLQNEGHKFIGRVNAILAERFPIIPNRTADKIIAQTLRRVRAGKL